MGIKGLIFLLAYGIAALGSVFYHPILGVLGYIAVYTIGPENQWWGRSLGEMGLRYSFYMGAAIAVGVVLHWKKLRLIGLHSQEVLLWGFVAVIWASTWIGLPNLATDDLPVKMTKVALFVWLLYRVVDSLPAYELVVWTLLLTGLFLGMDALTVSTGSFGRIDRGVGGADFSEGNFLGAHFAALLPLLGAMFYRSRWKGRAVVAVAAALVVNGIILCRSRGTFVGLLLGVVYALVFCPRTLRKGVIAITLLGVLGGVPLMDQGFLERMKRINPEVTDVEVQDDSAAGRLRAWKAALQMAADHPLGIGRGNFKYYVGRYDLLIPGKDTHSTFFRCLAELGFPGLLLYFALIANAGRCLVRVRRLSALAEDGNASLMHAYALSVCVVTFVATGLFITHTYIEELYWFLLLPIVLERAVLSRVVEEHDVVSSLPIGAGVERRGSALL